MPLWRIAPVARAGDPRWQDRDIWDEVVVRAPSASLARHLAGRLEQNPGPHGIGNESFTPAGGFQDEKLYRVVRVSDAAVAVLGGEDGPDGVIHARPNKGRMGQTVGR